ncbi:MAG: hypothetical protein KJZ85_08690 [Rhodobacteraceae bacterium]|nr:hypothetical protein [Paracoccaceae bacterium]
MPRPLPLRALGALRWRTREGLRHLRDRLATVAHDLGMHGRPRVTRGRLAPGRRMAVCLVFAAHGVPGSQLLALEHLTAAGYAAVVVSNLPLAAPDRDALAARAWRVVERANFGYDFGGYREGIRQVAPLLAGLDRLVLLNDSVWYPVPVEGADWLAAAEATGADFVGAVANDFAPPFPLEDWRGVGWRHDPAAPGFHYCSFALSLGPDVLRDPGFTAFWRRLALTGNKHDTVRRGEVGLTRWALERGHSHAATLDMAGFDRAVATLPEARLRAVLSDLVIPEEPPLRALKAEVIARDDGSAAWRAEAEAFLRAAVVRTGAAFALPAFALAEGRWPFLKKSPLRLDGESAAISQRLAAGLGGPMGAAIRAEAAAIAAAAGHLSRRG